MVLFVSICVYPTNLVSTSSVTCIQSPVSMAVAARLLFFCCNISFSNPASSTSKSFSLAINLVKSTGKPKVSNNSNTNFPSMVAPFECVFTISSMRFNPFSNVLKNPSSSSFTTLVTKSNCPVNSGKTFSNCFANKGMSWCNKGCL